MTFNNLISRVLVAAGFTTKTADDLEASEIDANFQELDRRTRLALYEASGGAANRMLNSRFDIWGYGTSFAAPANLTYVSEMWIAYRGTANRTYSRQAGFGGSKYCMRVARDSGSANTAGSAIAQPIPTGRIRDLAGKAVTISFWARCGANYSATASNLFVALYTGTAENEGSTAFWSPGWTGFATSASSLVTLTTTAQRFTVTCTLPAGALEGVVWIEMNPTGTAGAADYFEITDVELKEGSASTTDEFRDPLVVAADVFPYHPRYESTGTASVLPGVTTAYSAVASYCAFAFPSACFKAPTGITISSPSHFSLQYAGGTAVPSAVTLSSGELMMGSLAFTTSGVTTPNAGRMYFNNASAYLRFTGCEL